MRHFGLWQYYGSLTQEDLWEQRGAMGTSFRFSDGLTFESPGGDFDDGAREQLYKHLDSDS